MPLPLLFIIPAVATGLAGIGAGTKAGVDYHKASKTNKSAKEKVDYATKLVENARENTNTSLENLGKEKIFVLDKSINKFISIFELIKNVDFEKSENLNDMTNFKMDKASFEELKETSNYATSIVAGAAGGAIGGALTAFGAWGAAGALATASTGTAIGTLSGVAATNATLAFFGGGSLAAGGLGMAGGAAVLGGLVAGPALAIMGIVLGANAKKTKENAYANMEVAKKTVEEFKTIELSCHGIYRRANMFYRLLIRLNALFFNLLLNMEAAAKEHNYDYSLYTDEQKKNLAASVSMAATIKAVLDTSLLNEEGNLTEESLKILEEIKQ